MARTTAEAVKVLINTSLENAEIAEFIEDASSIVDDRLDGEGLSNTLLTRIEKYLTAHLIAISRERQASDEKIGDVSVKYAGKFGKYLEQTSYGQHVLILDTTGKMARSGKMKASIKNMNIDRTTWK